MKKGKHYHFIGIGGIGMSALARVLLEKGAHVTGSDIKRNAQVQELENLGAQIFLGHDKKRIDEGMNVVYSTEINKKNAEYDHAHNLNLPLYHRSELLNQLMEGYKPLLVAGSHGKTTTSALLAHTLINAGLNSPFVIGGMAPSLNANGKSGGGDYFVAEADESDGSLMTHRAYGAILTNAGEDHINYWKTLSKLREAFSSFAGTVENKKLFFFCQDDKALFEMKLDGVSYGFSKDSSLFISHMKQDSYGCCFDIVFQKKSYKEIRLPLMGQHNVLNAAAVFGMALCLGVDEEKIRSAFSSFKGVNRRLEKKGICQGVEIYDDYAHHPREIKATLQALRERVKEKKIITIFQPHRYSRIKECLEELKRSFQIADEVILTEIYSAGEEPVKGLNGQTIVDLLIKENVRAHHVKQDDLLPFCLDIMRPLDVLITMGAGDITDFGETLINALEKKNLKKRIVGVISGGMSVEHEISHISAKSILSTFNKQWYEVKQFQIDKEGKWLFLSEDKKANFSENKSLIGDNVINELQKCDVCFPVLHGPYGEDGTIQGLFEMLSIPYVGSDFRSCSVAMDKVLTKKIAFSSDLATSAFVSILLREWQDDPISCLNRADNLKFPLIVKAAHLGSSVGVIKVEKEDTLKEAIEECFNYDTNLLVEEFIIGREVEFALLGDEWIEVTAPGEILSNGHVYDYERKYGSNPMETKTEADLPKELIEKGKEFVKRVYNALGCSGMARIDCFLDKEGNYLLSEVNPIPGFTAISLYPKMFEAYGIDYKTLIDRLVLLAIRRHFQTKKKLCKIP